MSGIVRTLPYSSKLFRALLDAPEPVWTLLDAPGPRGILLDLLSILVGNLPNSSILVRNPPARSSICGGCLTKMGEFGGCPTKMDGTGGCLTKMDDLGGFLAKMDDLGGSHTKMDDLGGFLTMANTQRSMATPLSFWAITHAGYLWRSHVVVKTSCGGRPHAVAEIQCGAGDSMWASRWQTRKDQWQRPCHSGLSPMACWALRIGDPMPCGDPMWW